MTAGRGRDVSGFGQAFQGLPGGGAPTTVGNRMRGLSGFGQAFISLIDSGSQGVTPPPPPGQAFSKWWYNQLTPSERMHYNLIEGEATVPMWAVVEALRQAETKPNPFLPGSKGGIDPEKVLAQLYELAGLSGGAAWRENGSRMPSRGQDASQQSLDAREAWMTRVRSR